MEPILDVTHHGGRQPVGEVLVDIPELTRTSAYLTHSDYTVPDAVQEVARQIPDHVAIESGSDRLTYADLASRANQLANALLDRGLDPAKPVLLLCDHGVEPPTAICGVLHAGLIAAPVDVREPLDRLCRLVEASGAEWVVAGRAHAELARALNANVLLLDETEQLSDDAPQVEIGEAQPGLILFTSGSTGAPKGVVWAHRAIVPRSMRFRPGALAGDERFALTASWGFTVAQDLLFSGLTNGVPIYTYDLRAMGARGLPDWVRRSRITHLMLTPSVLRPLVESTPPGTMDCVREVLLGAETLYASDVRSGRLLFGPDTVLRNGLGSTEAGTISRSDVPPDDELEDGPVPVGAPDVDVEVRFVDDDDQPVLAGEAGRMVVVRRGHLALGYWRDPELTAAHFFREPDGRQGFRTSDRGRLRPDGMLDHLGRLDTRVKVRGAMVATSEVEIALVTLDGVAEAAVTGAPDDDGGTRLVAYVAPDGTAPLSAWKLRRDLAARVPTSMIPSAFVALDVLPRTIRHKIDRAALPPPPPPSRRPYRAPSGSFFESGLADLFADVLGVERIGLDDDFFEMGGDSLGVVELLSAIREAFAVDLPATAVLEAPTVDQLAARLTQRRPPGSSPVVALRTDADGAPFFCMTGGGAPAIALRALARAVDGRAFYAVQARGLEERALPDRSIEAVARRNVDAIRAVQRRGPYALGGHSFGGLVAFETACRLRGAGESVELLVVLDTSAPLGGRQIARRVRAQRERIEEDAPARGLARTAVVGTRAVRALAGSAYAHAARRFTAASAGLLTRRGVDQYQAFYRLHELMARKYRPSATFDGRVLVVRAGASDDLGWSQLTTGPVEVVQVPGDHNSLLRLPAVEQVGRYLSDSLA